MSETDAFDEAEHMEQDAYDDGQDHPMSADDPAQHPHAMQFDETIPDCINSDPVPGNPLVETKSYSFSGLAAYDTSNHSNGSVQRTSRGELMDNMPLQLLPLQEEPIHANYDGAIPRSDYGMNDHRGIEQLGDGQAHGEAYPVEPAYGDVQPAPGHADADPPPASLPVAPKKTKKVKKKRKKVQQQHIPDEARIPMALLQATFNGYQPESEPKPMQEQMHDQQSFQERDHDQQTYDTQAEAQQQYPHQQYEQQQYSELDNGLQRSDPPQYADQDDRLATPHQNQHVDVSSPQTQLNEDLQAAPWNPDEDATRTSVPAPPLKQRKKRRLPMMPTNPPPTDPRYLPNTPASGVNSQPASRDESGGERLDQTPGHSPAEQPSSDIEDGFTHLFEKVNKRSAKREAQLTAEKQSLSNELQQAKSTKSSLEARISTLQQEKEGLSASLEKLKATQAELKRKGSKFQTFVNGIGKDIDQLKKEADSYRQQSQALVEEGRAQMSKHHEESTRLNAEVIKQCQATKFQLSTAATRAAHLEETLKQRSADLAEEKKYRVQLQSQKELIEDVKNAVLGQMQADHNEVLEKLYEVHAMLEDVDNRQEVTEMLDKTVTAIQGLNLQQATTVDDVVSVKGMMESLTESMSRSINERSSGQEEKLSELQSRIKELEVELQSKTAEVTALQEKVDSTPPPAPTSNADVEMIRKEAIAFQAQQQAEMENELKKLRARPGKDELLKLRQQLADAQRQADSRQRDVDNLNEQLETEKRELSSAQNLADTRQQDLDKMNEQLATEKRHLESQLEARPSQDELASTKEQLAEAQRLADSRRQEVDALNVQIQNEKRELSTAQRVANSRQQDIEKLNEQLQNEKRVFEKKIGGLPTPEQLSSAQEKLAEAQQLANEKQENIGALNTQLEKEKERYQRLESGLEQYRGSCDTAIAEEKQRGSDRVEALQQQLAQSREELEGKSAQEEEFRAKVAASWQEEQTKFQEQLASLRQQLEEAHRQPQADLQNAQRSEHRNVRSSSPVVGETQQEDALHPPAASKKRKERPVYADTQDAYGHIQDTMGTLSGDEQSDKENALTYQKRLPMPNSSSKRAMPREPQSRSSGKSSSPAFMSQAQESQQRCKSTTYGVGSSGHKRHASHGKEQTKRKASSSQIVTGYEDERRKMMKPNTPGPNPRSQPNPVPNRLSMGSSQSGSRRVTRSNTQEMNARFAQELPSKSGHLTGGLGTRQK